MARPRLTCCALVCALGLALAGACGDGDDASTYHIVFQSDRGGSEDIYLMRDDGTEVEQITDEPGFDYEPDSSPDGSTLVFVSDRGGDGNTQLYLMNIDGSDVRRLTFAPKAEERSIVDDYPHWSPEGGRIVFQRNTRGPEGTDADIWMVDVESGQELQLTDTPDDWDSTPSFEPGGASIIFESDRDGDFDIYRMDLATREIEQVTNADGSDFEAKASPDGTRIAFASDRDGDFEVYSMAVDGSDVRQLTDNDVVDRCSHWSPDSQRLTFFSERDGNQEIYVMNADGSEQTRLTENNARDEIPDWIVLPD